MQATPRRSPALAVILSLIVPGAGQFYSGKASRGIAVLVTAALLISLPLWDHAPALLAGAGILWLWNLWDARRAAEGQSAPMTAAAIAAALVVYAVGWQQSGIDLKKLRDTRAMVSVLTRLTQPDVLTREEHTQVGHLKIQVPCSSQPPVMPTPDPTQPSLAADFPCRAVGDKLTLYGSNFIPGTSANIYWISPIGNETPLRENDRFIMALPDASGRFTVTIAVPNVVPKEQDPTKPQIHQVNIEFAQPYGNPYPSDIARYVAGKMVETIVIALLATLGGILFAIPLSFFAARNIMGRTRLGLAVYYAMRFVFNITRAIEPLIWGLIFIVWVGQGSFAGVLALMLHSVAALGKLYSEEIEHIDPGPVEAVNATGANLIQTIRFAVWPQVVPSFLGYTLLRWDINVRMSTVLGFVGGGGIGFFLVESVRKNAYNEYATAMWSIALVVLILDYASARWREAILNPQTSASAQAPEPFYRSWRKLALIAGGLAVFVYSWRAAGIDPSQLIYGWSNAVRLGRDFIRMDLGLSTVETVARLMTQTIFMALLATTVGSLLAIPFSFLAARNLAGRSLVLRWIYYLTRSFMNLTRSIEALVYVGIFVAWVSIGPFAGVIALTVTTFALMGKLFSEAVENIDPGPLEAITATGANRLQVIVYGVIPQIVPPFISYAIYQWDINIRMSTIVGFAGGGGIGFQLQTWMNEIGSTSYHKAGTAVFAIALVVAVMDYLSARLREKLV